MSAHGVNGLGWELDGGALRQVLGGGWVDANRSEVDECNADGLRGFVLSCILMQSVSLVVGVMASLSSVVVANIVLDAVFVLLYLLCNRFASRHPERSLPLLYAVQAPVVLTGIALDTFVTPHAPALAFLLMLVFLPPFILDKPPRLCGVFAGYAALFLVCCLAVKDPGVARQDVVHLAAFLAGAAALGVFVIRQRAMGVENFVRVREAGRTDALTGLLTVDRLVELTPERVRAMREAGDEPVAIALDVIGMRAFNVARGNRAGDDLIRAVGAALVAHLGRDACARSGEDHFCALSTAREAPAALRAVFADLAAAPWGVALRAGVCVCRDERPEGARLAYEGARAACDRDRAAASSHVVWMDEAMLAETKRRDHVVSSLGEALAKGWITVRYQPVVRAVTSQVCGFEALARWEDPELGELAPGAFVPVLEDAHLMLGVDLRVAEIVAADLAARLAAGGRAAPVSINVSRHDLGQADMPQRLARIMDEAGVPHGLVKVEITESAAVSDAGLVTDAIRGFHAAGFEVWMDDFGSGYSSLGTLVGMGFDLVKLDMSLTGGVGASTGARVVAAHTVRMAAQLGMKTLAEGIERPEQLRALRDLGCERLQGFYFSKPMRLGEVMDALARRGLVLEDGTRRDYLEAVSAADIEAPFPTGETVPTGEAAPEGGGFAPEFPAGVIERRDGSYWVLRRNAPYSEFLVKWRRVDASSAAASTGPLPFKTQVLSDFDRAFDRCLATGGWERTAVPFERQTGLRFYVRRVAVPAAGDGVAPGDGAAMLVGVPVYADSTFDPWSDLPGAFTMVRAVRDAAGRIVDAEFLYVNEAFCRIMGKQREELVGHTYVRAFVNADAARWLGYVARAVDGGEVVRGVAWGPIARHWLNLVAAAASGEGCCSIIFLDDDVAQQERATDDLIIRIAEALNGGGAYEDAMRAALGAIGRTLGARRVYVLERGADGRVSSVGWHVGELPPAPGEARGASAAGDAGASPAAPRGARVVAAPMRPDGATRGALVVEGYDPAESANMERVLRTAALFLSETAENNRLVRRLNYASTHDELTGLPNRRALYGDADRIAAGQEVVVIYADLNGLKEVNDGDGHGAGDALLRDAARALERAFGEGTAYRVGGDEFVVLMKAGDDVPRDAAALQRMVRSRLDEQGGDTMAVGVALYRAGESFQGAARRADRAMYADKARRHRRRAR
ncbi:EAL domain-containing protein [bacterium]|nr:EAL domain-containing protein [bacterium]